MESVDVDMHPLEEAALLAEWSINEERENFPKIPSTDELIQMMLESGQEIAKQHVANIELARKNGEEALAPRVAALKDKYAVWNEHCKRCEELKVDRDTHEKEKYNGKV